MKDYLSGPEVAERCGVALGTVHNWRRRGEGPPHYKVGKIFRFPLREFEIWWNEKFIRPEIEMNGAA